MTPLATRHQPRYTNASSKGGAYGYQLIKNPRVSGFSQGYRLADTTPQDHTLPARCVGGFAFTMPPILARTWRECKLTLEQMALRCVKLFTSSKNRRSHFSLAKRENGCIMIVRNLNKKRESDASHIAPRTSHNLLVRSKVMSLQHVFYHVSAFPDNEQILINWGFGS